ncbi:MAG: Uma2 family endonuclease [Bryobacteraceae bacterium]|jgi:Uma2 family endonuclease
MSTQPKTFLTPEQYLAIEREAPYKSEYHAGEMLAMAGAREGHNLVSSNTVRELSGQLRARPCRVYGSDMRVGVGPDHYVYPDVTAACGAPQFLDLTRDTLLNPNLIVEVLSPSTEAYDRGRKFELYQSIPSFTEYLLLASDRVHADLYVRQPGGLWLRSSFGELNNELTLESVSCRLKLADLYEKVEFDRS